MAVAFQSLGSGKATSTTFVTITKPSSLAAGDLLILHFHARYSTSAANTHTLPSGFTIISGGGNTSTHLQTLAWKWADAGDVAAGSFTVTSNRTFVAAIGHMSRLTGASLSNPITERNNFAAVSSTITHQTVTVNQADGLTYAHGSGLGGSVTVPTPASYDSRFNDIVGSGSNIRMWAFTRTNPPTGATGDVVVTASGSLNYVTNLIYIEAEDAQTLGAPARLDRELTGGRALYAPTLAGGVVTITQTARLEAAPALYAPTLAGGAETQALAQDARLEVVRALYAPGVSSPPPTLDYRVAADLGRTGLFDAADADLTPYVKQASWLNGFERDDDYAALHPSRLDLVLDNRSGRFLPENSSSPLFGRLVEGTLIRIQVYTGAWKTLYIGKIAGLDATVGRARADKDAYLRAESPTPQLLKAEYASELFVNTTIDQPLEAMFDRGLVPWEYETSHWFLGVAGGSELGETTTLFVNTITDFELGVTEFDWIGDNLDRGLGVNPAALIQQTTEADLARFWWEAREAKYKLFNREHFSTKLTNDAALTGPQINIDGSEYGVDSVVNDVTLVYEPRETGAPGSVVYLHPSLPLAMLHPFERTLIARYNTVNDVIDAEARIGVLDGIEPVAGTDYQVSDENPPTGDDGDDETHYLAVNVTNFADRAEIKLRTLHQGTRYLHRFQLRGTPLIARGRDQVTNRNPDSIAAYRLGLKTLVNPMIHDEEYAQSYVDYVSAQWADPTPRFSQIHLTVADDAPQFGLLPPETVLSLAIGSRINVTVEDIGHDRDYFVIGERHSMIAGAGPMHEVDLFLTPASRVAYWSLGTVGMSELDETTRLAF